MPRVLFGQIEERLDGLLVYGMLAAKSELEKCSGGEAYNPGGLGSRPPFSSTDKSSGHGVLAVISPASSLWSDCPRFGSCPAFLVVRSAPPALEDSEGLRQHQISRPAPNPFHVADPEQPGSLRQRGRGNPRDGPLGWRRQQRF